MSWLSWSWSIITKSHPPFPRKGTETGNKRLQVRSVRYFSSHPPFPRKGTETIRWPRRGRFLRCHTHLFPARGRKPLRSKAASCFLDSSVTPTFSPQGDGNTPYFYLGCALAPSRSHPPFPRKGTETRYRRFCRIHQGWSHPPFPRKGTETQILLVALRNPLSHTHLFPARGRKQSFSVDEPGR